MPKPASAPTGCWQPPSPAREFAQRRRPQLEAPRTACYALGMTRASLLFALCLPVATGCGPKVVEPVVPGAAEIVLSENTAPAGYVEVQQLSVQSGKGCGFTGQAGSRQDADAKLRGEAAKLGATFVHVTDVQAPRPNHQCLEHEHKLGGVAYRKVVAQPATAAPLP